MSQEARSYQLIRVASALPLPSVRDTLATVMDWLCAPLPGTEMFIRLGPSAAVLGWLLLILGIAYVLYGTYGTLSATPGSLPRIVTGLVGVVVGTSILRWVQRSRGGPL